MLFGEELSDIIFDELTTHKGATAFADMPLRASTFADRGLLISKGASTFADRGLLISKGTSAFADMGLLISKGTSAFADMALQVSFCDKIS